MNPQKQIVTVHTSTPNIEHRPGLSAHNQIYQNEVNVLSIMYGLAILKIIFKKSLDFFVIYQIYIFLVIPIRK